MRPPLSRGRLIASRDRFKPMKVVVVDRARRLAMPSQAPFRRDKFKLRERMSI